jgi:hypothetical protein
LKIFHQSLLFNSSAFFEQQQLAVIKLAVSSPAVFISKSVGFAETGTFTVPE